MNLYPSFEQGVKSELPLLKHLTLLRIEVTAERFGQCITVHYLTPMGPVLHHNFQMAEKQFLVAGRELHPRSVQAIGRLLGKGKVTVDTSPQRSSEVNGFSFVFQP